MSILNYNTIIQTSNLIMPDDLNPDGSLFGGKIMAEMDKTAAMAAKRFCGHHIIQGAKPFKVVTRHVNEIDFTQPAFLGEMYTVYAEIIDIGNSSVKVKVTVEAEDLNTGGPARQITSAVFVFVAIDRFGNKAQLHKNDKKSS